MLLKYIYRYACLVGILFILACEKQTVEQADFSTLHLYGWVPDPGVIVASLKDEPLTKYSEALRVTPLFFNLNMSRVYIDNPVQPLALYAFPDTLPTSMPVKKLNLELEKQQIYSLFVGGTEGELETTLVKENFPVLKRTDSLAGVRFLNLIKGGPVSINIEGQPYGSLVQRVPFMDVTEFTFHNAKEGVMPMTFEVRDETTHELLLSFRNEEVAQPDGAHEYWLSRLRTYSLIGLRNQGPTSSNRPRVQRFIHN